MTSTDSAGLPRHARSAAPSRRRSAAAALLVVAMAIGSVAMWLGAPLGWLYLASTITASTQPQLGPYLLVLAGTPITMVLIARVLRGLDRRYGALVGAPEDGSSRAPWLRSMRDAPLRDRPTTILDRVMVVSVGAALVVMAVWFFGFAGSSLPMG